MARSFISATSILFLFGALFIGAHGNPACSKRHQQASECVNLCKPGWGFPGKPTEDTQAGPGLFLGADPWGSVISNSGKTLEEWVADACGVQISITSASSPATVTDNVTETTSELDSTTSTTLTSISVRRTTAPTTTSSPTTTTTSRTTTSSPTTTTAPTTTTSPTTTTPTTTTRPTIAAAPTTTSTTSSPEPEPTEDAPPRIASGAADNNITPQDDPPRVASGAADNNITPQDDPPKVASGAADTSRPSSGSSGNDIEVWLSAHNSLRSKHGGGALTWSDQAAAKAQEWANKCLFEHSGGSLGPFGENLAAGTGDYGINTAFDAWADEESEYNESSPKPSHYTQVVWKGTTQVGCALAPECDGIFDAEFGKARYYVCEYSPQGNIIGRFGDNVQ